MCGCEIETLLSGEEKEKNLMGRTCQMKSKGNSPCKECDNVNWISIVLYRILYFFTPYGIRVMQKLGAVKWIEQTSFLSFFQ
jgi:hypothetical protein